MKTTLQHTTLQMTDRTSERWVKIEPKIRVALLEYGLELNPPKLSEIFAKVHTGETLGGKGIFLLGTTGTGKTARMRWMASAFGMIMQDAEDLCDLLMGADSPGEKNDILQCTPPRWSEVPLHYNDLVIDDLGTEPDGQNIYGTRRDVMEEAIHRRYNVFPRWKTHFTSNLTKAELRSRYGERAWSRLNEMVVFVTLTGKDRRLGNR